MGRFIIILLAAMTFGSITAAFVSVSLGFGDDAAGATNILTTGVLFFWLYGRSLHKRPFGTPKNQTGAYPGRRGRGHSGRVGLAGPGYVYLMEMGGLTKLGITNNDRRRVGDHQRHGWRHVKSWQFASYNDARNVESMVHGWADSMGHLPKDKSLQAYMPQGGYTEVMTLDAPTVLNYVDSAVL